MESSESVDGAGTAAYRNGAGDRVVLPGGEVVGRAFADHVGGQRVAEQVALREVAAERAQRLELRRRLQALGHRRQLERVREPDDRLDDARVLVVAAETVDERAIDL